MSRELLHVFREDTGELIGYSEYSHTADVWCVPIYPSLAAVCSSRGWTCLDEEGHSLTWVMVYDPQWDPRDEFARLQACLSCRALVLPPFDGYVYHEYGCPLGHRCRCSEEE